MGAFPSINLVAHTTRKVIFFFFGGGGGGGDWLMGQLDIQLSAYRMK